IVPHYEAALISLKEIKCSYHDDDDQKKSGFKLEFFFYPNPYFGNSVLTKTYHLSYEHDERVLESATGTEIEWYQGKCLTQKTRVLRRNGKEPEPKTEDCESFFNFFKSPHIPKDGEEKLDEEVQDKLEQDYDMTCTLRDKIVPHAVSWFTGEAAIRARDDWPDDDDEEEDNANENANENEEEQEDDDEDEVITDMKESDAEVSHLQQCERPPECTQQ
ncbi:Nucleosome assembly protein 1-like 4, partial [Linum grandiflorum]